MHEASQEEETIGYFAGILAAGAALGRAGSDGLPGFAQELLRASGVLVPPWASRPDLDWLAEQPAFRAAFVRGYFDRAGQVPEPTGPELRVRLTRPRAPWFEEALLTALGGPLEVCERRLSWHGPAALDLLGRLYGSLPGSAESLLVRPKYLRRYRAWCRLVSGLGAARGGTDALRVTRLDPAAILPSKVRISDSGYDLSLIAESKRLGQVVLYGTGLAIEPPFGWYFDVVARSSLIKTGYIVANSVGVIDRAYRGEILVPLIKLDPASADLELPARAVQLVPRPVVHFPVVDALELGQTERGALGFGSSG